MTIEKTSATRLRVEGAPYTTLPNQTLQHIYNPDALAIWAYLQSQATGWRPSRNHLMKHFNLGRSRYNNAMNNLRDLGLIETIMVVENDTNKFLGREIVCYYSAKTPKCTKTDTSENRKGGKTGTSGKQELPENDHLEINQDNINVSKKRETVGKPPRTPQKRKTPLPPGFNISDAVREWAEKKGHTRLEDHLEAFKLKCEKHEYKYINWDRAFMDAIRSDWAGLNKQERSGVRTHDIEALASKLGMMAKPGESWEQFGIRVHRENERRLQ